MISFRLHDADSAPDHSRDILADLHDCGTELPNLLRTLAESPIALDAYRQLTRLLATSSLTALEQQVVYLTAAHTNQCHYCTSPNPMLGGGEQAEEIALAIRQGGRLADPRLQALRRFTALMTEQRGWISDDHVAAFIEAGYSRANLLEVVTGIALVTLSSYANHLAATPIDAVVGQVMDAVPGGTDHRIAGHHG